MESSIYDLTYTDLNPKYLFSFFISRTEEESNYHAHDFIEIGIILSGGGHFHINGKDYPAETGDLFIMNPGTYHRFVPDFSSNQTLSEFYLAFTDVEFKDCPKDHFPLFANYQFFIKMPDGLRQDIFKICQALSRESKSWQPGQYFMLKSYLIQMICLIIRYQKQRGKEKDEKEHPERYVFKNTNKKYIVHQITKYLEEHYQEKTSLDQIASNMYLSSYYVSKIFKSETGDTPINYLISLRMQKAKEMLDENPNLSVQEVAVTVGYDDAYHFSKLFKKYFGISPLYYKGRS